MAVEAEEVAPTVVGGALPQAVARKPPTFAQNWWSPISYILYAWYGGILQLGSKRTLQYEDIFDIPPKLQTKNVYPGFQSRFDAYAAPLNGGTPKEQRQLQRALDGETSRFVLYSIFGQHKLRLLYALILQCFYSGVQFVGPLMLNHIVKFLSASQALDLTGQSVTSSQLTQAWLYAMGMFLAPVVGSLGAGQANRISIGTQIMIRAELTAAIYRKALRLSTRAKQMTETGRIVNLMSADVNQLQSFFYPFASQLVTGPAMLVTSLVLLWFQIRWATFIGLAILLVSTPATTIFLKKIIAYRREMLKHTDTRVKLMNQLLVGIRVLKMYAWEAAQEAAVLEVRRKELGQLRNAIPHRVGLQTLLSAAPTLAMVVCFVVYGTVVPSSFTPANIFTSIALFALMRFPLIFLPFALIQLSNALVSMRRLTQYFMLEDRQEVVGQLPEPGIEIKHADFFWSEPPPKIPEIVKGKGKGTGKKEKKNAAAATKPDAAAANGAVNGHANGHANGHSVGSEGAEGGKPAPPSPGDSVASVLGAADAKAGAEGAAAGKGDKSLAAAWWLRGIDLTVRPGELVCVVGRVGSGKSSLVQGILGEMELAEGGSVAVGGRLAYAAQQAWIINATVKENVAFGAPFDQARWEAAVEACCLASDLEILPAGADTEIGEKGINLSGGQKQRVSLARALYNDADVYILDDPLSAVDVHVGRHIFEQFINGAIKSKARLLVTNQLQYLGAADRIIVMDAGHVAVAGTYEECAGNEVFARLLSEHTLAAEAAGAAAEKGNGGGGGEDGGKKPPRPLRSESAVGSRATVDAMASAPGGMARAGVQDVNLERGETFARLPERKSSANAADRASSGEYGKQLGQFKTMARQTQLADEAGGKADDKDKKGAGGKFASQVGGDKASLMLKEDQEEGQVTGRIYWQYIKAYGVLSFFSLIFLWSAEQSVRILTTWWLSRWTQAEIVHSYYLSAAESGTSTAGLPDSFDRAPYIGGYLGFAFGFVALTAIRSLTNLLSALRASRVVHHNAIKALVRAPVTFFDTTPVGRILNRFSKDTDDIDFLLSMSMSEFGNCIMQLLSTLIFLAVVQPIILAGVAPLMLLYYFIQRFYRRSYIEMQRIDAVSRSPIYAHFSESLSGVETIRAYRLAAAFAATSDARVDANHRAYFTARMANEWLSLRLDLIGACIVFLAAVLAITRRNSISASLAAMTLQEALDVTLFLKTAVTSGAMFESRFNSVERVSAYWELPQEAPAKNEDTTPPDEWPTQGALQYQDVWMRYRPELDPVLRGVTFSVSPGDKVGIVGRTGSGKSSLIVTLFRIVEPFQGQIVLDGIDLLTLGLDEVRGRIAAIPQDPVLFSGSVRTNLDPYGRHSDAELWDALGHVALKQTVAGLPEGLSARVAEGGENFSVGQRQLLCVGRALLRRPRVLVADEATASVDSETDALIQRTIRREFSSCTVLTIAHRINTVLDSTRVLVMEDGRVKEYDAVPTLMGRSDSSFRAMVLEAGGDSPAVSRSSSAHNLSAAAGEGSPGAGARPVGANTFVRRLKGGDYGLDK